jgi:hypothetical protein
MRLQAKLLLAGEHFDPSRISTQDVTKLTVEDLNYLNSHWRNRRLDPPFERCRFLRIIHHQPPQPNLTIARYLILSKYDPDLPGEEDPEGLIGEVLVTKNSDGYMNLGPDYHSYKLFTTREEALMAFATHGMD